MAVGFPAKTNFATGDVLTATQMNDITGTLNLLQSTLYPAGRNKIINGDFNVNQRAFTSTTTSGTYGFDRFKLLATDGTSTYSAQTFTPGDAPVAGYEAKNFARLVSTGQTLTTARTVLTQPIESVRTFANQSVIVSFWAKAGSGTPSVAVNIQQYFDPATGGSATVDTPAGKTAITTSWVRYSLSVAIPSISGKTIGTSTDPAVQVQFFTSAGSTYNTQTTTLGIQTTTIDLWGIQIEAASTGSTASPFQTASGSIGGELALCQRYYQRQFPNATTGGFGVGFVESATTAYIKIPAKVTMRTAPTALEQTGTATDYGVRIAGGTTVTCSAVPAFFGATADELYATFTVAAGLVAGQALFGRSAATAAYLGWSAEL